MSEQKFITSQEACEMTGWTRRTLGRLIKNGSLEVYRRPGDHSNYYAMVDVIRLSTPVKITPQVESTTKGV